MDVSAGISFLVGTSFGQAAAEVAPLGVGAGQIQRLAVAGRRLLHPAKADMYRRLGRAEEAAACYRDALELASTDAERRYLSRRLAETGAG